MNRVPNHCNEDHSVSTTTRDAVADVLNGDRVARNSAASSNGHAGKVWDRPELHGELLRLTWKRSAFRFRRALNRLRSPRRAFSTCLSAVCFALYLMSGLMILSNREPADSDRLRLWLSGGMAFYILYHTLKCVWARRSVDLELTRAEMLWLGGAPLKRSTLAVHQLADAFAASAMKTMLLVIVIHVDVRSITRLALAMFVSLLLLETCRVVLQRWIVALSNTQVARLRWGVSLVAAAVVALLVARLIVRTPFGSPPVHYVLQSFHSIGDVAAMPVMQWLALPWFFPAQLATLDTWDLTALAATLALLPLAVWSLVWADRWAWRASQQKERIRLNEVRRSCVTGEQTSLPGFNTSTMNAFDWLDRWLPMQGWMRPAWQQFATVVMRQAISIRRYRGEIMLSFLLPTLLCLSPLMTDHTRNPWLFVVGGVCLCTILLAPPALRLDFRRDLKRMLLLRGLPVTPLALVCGQLALPTLITIIFQWLVLSIASLVLGVGVFQAALWMTILPAVALTTFATENALFLMYPHHEHAQGIAMLLRTKLIFLGKSTLIVMALALMVSWAWLTGRWFEGRTWELAFYAGSTLATTGFALASVWLTRHAWSRFALIDDTPPE